VSDVLVIAPPPCALIIWDDLRRAHAPARNVERCGTDSRGWECIVAGKIETALEAAATRAIAAIIWCVPDGEKEPVTRVQTLRARFWGTPVLIISNKLSEEERCFLLDAGAAMCVHGSGGDNELAHSVHAQARQAADARNKLFFDGAYELDHQARWLRQTDSVSVPGVRLSREEYLLVRCLVARPGQTVPYNDVDLAVWHRVLGRDNGPRRKLLPRVRKTLKLLGLRILADHGIGLRLERKFHEWDG
jgi:DNA-binding response OmpR family regulator